MALLYEEVSQTILDAAFEVHRTLGSGFLEATYAKALCYELEDRGLKFEREVSLPIRYKQRPLGDCRLDLVVNRQIVLELKAVSQIVDAHLAQARHYLSATGLRLALVLNFGAPRLQCRRVVV